MKNVWKVIESTPAQIDLVNVEEPHRMISYEDGGRRIPVVARGAFLKQVLVPLDWREPGSVGWLALGMFNFGAAFGYCLKWWIGVTN